MKKIFILMTLLWPVFSLAQGADIGTQETNKRTSISPDNRVVLLELYTSEGCSSCPPADEFLSSLKEADVSDQQLIPLAFHVTYWDYIGWKDRFSKQQYDQRQRDLAHKNKKKSVYTPQFMLSGKDYRSYATFSDDVNNLTREKATVDIILSVADQVDKHGVDRLRLKLQADISASRVKDVGFYLVVIEDDLSSDISDGENSGEKLHHDYVVRQMLGPYIQHQDELRLQREQVIELNPVWKKDDLSIVAFAEDQQTGEVLQAVRLKY